MYFYLIHYIICDNSQSQHFDRVVFRDGYNHGQPSGKALEDICDCDAVEIVTSKVCSINDLLYLIKVFEEDPRFEVITIIHCTNILLFFLPN